MKKKLCECGCGEIVRRSKNRFVHGHNNAGKEFPGRGYKIAESRKHPKRKSRRIYCACGCHALITSGRTWITGHCRRGVPLTPDEIKERSESRMGHLVSLETRRKISENRQPLIGEAHPNWQGGVIIGHSRLGAPALRRLKYAVRKRDGYKCLLCQNKGSMIPVHHVVPVRVGHRSRLCDHESNMVCLCNSCHSSVEGGNAKNWKSILPEAIDYIARFGHKHILARRYFRV